MYLYINVVLGLEPQGNLGLRMGGSGYFDTVYEVLASIDASGSLFGSSGIHYTGLGCQKTHPKQIFIDFTNIWKCKCVF